VSGALSSSLICLGSDTKTYRLSGAESSKGFPFALLKASLITSDEWPEDILQYLCHARLYLAVSNLVSSVQREPLTAYNLLGHQCLVEEQNRNQSNNTTCRVESCWPGGTELKIHVVDLVGTSTKSKV
jgi:hypothetical protein